MSVTDSLTLKPRPQHFQAIWLHNRLATLTSTQRLTSDKAGKDGSFLYEFFGKAVKIKIVLRGAVIGWGDLKTFTWSLFWRGVRSFEGRALGFIYY